MQRQLNPNEAAQIDAKLHDNTLLEVCHKIWPERQEEITSVMVQPEDIFYESAWLIDELVEADTDTDATNLTRKLWSTVFNDIGHWANGVSLGDRYLIASTIFRLVATAFSLHWRSYYCDILRDALITVVEEKCPSPKDLHEQQQLERQQDELLNAIIACSASLKDWVNDYIDNPESWLTEEIEQALNPPKTIVLPNAESKKVDFKPVSATFTKSGTVLNANLTLVFQFLVEKKWIAQSSDPDAFMDMFLGKSSEKTIIWLKAKGVLRDLFKMFIDEGVITCPDGYTYLQIVSSHFTDKDGNYLTDLNSGYSGKKIQADLSQILVLMKAKYNHEDE